MSALYLGRGLSAGDGTGIREASGQTVNRAPKEVFLAVLVAFLPAFSTAVVPSHDSLGQYTVFWTYVSALVTEGRLPEWIPFIQYGAPATTILMYITPVAYVTGALGALLHVLWHFNDTLLLFK